MLKFKRVVVGISGGVDSAIAALLLKLKGYDVQGVFMQNWDIADEKGRCSASEDYKDAQFVCDKLNIKLHHVNFVKEYWNEVFTYLIKEYEAGNTPNPDILCNRNIKFRYFYDYAINKLNADAIATGHYVKTSFGPYLEHFKPNSNVSMQLATDVFKDQTFFLCQIEQTALRRTMFPLGDYMKSEVKQMAIDHGLEKFAKKKESMGICFIGSRNFQDFIKEYVMDKPGDFVDLDTGKIVGIHNGLHQWTLGQRARLHGLPEAYFIARKNLEKNIIYVVQGTHHPILFTKLFFTGTPHWICPKSDDNSILQCHFKFQHTKPWVPCQIYKTSTGLVVKLENSIRAITPGQYAVFSKGNEVLGSARIENSGISDYALNFPDLSNTADLTSIINKYKIDFRDRDGLGKKEKLIEDVIK